MDEFEIAKAFTAWKNETFGTSASSTTGSYMWCAWLESARRADKRAREECAEICKSTKEHGLTREEINRNLLRGNPDGKTEGFQKAVDECYAAIRATIKEEPT